MNKIDRKYTMGFETYSRTPTNGIPQPQQQQQQRSFASLAQQQRERINNTDNNNASVLANAQFSLARWFADRILPFKKPTQTSVPLERTKVSRNNQQRTTTTPTIINSQNGTIEKLPVDVMLGMEALASKQTMVSTTAMDLTNAITDVIDETSRMSLSTTESTQMEKRVFAAVLEAATTADTEERKQLFEPQETILLPFQTRYSSWKTKRATELENQLDHLDSILQERAVESSKKAVDLLRSREVTQALIQGEGLNPNLTGCTDLLEAVPALWKQTISSKIEEKLEEIVKTSSNLLKECVLASGGLPKEATIADKVRLRRLMEFCSSVHERTAQRAAALKQLMENDVMNVVSEAYNEAAQTKLSGPKQHQDILRSVPEIPTEAVKNIQQRFAKALDTNLIRLDSMAQEIDSSATTVIAALKTNPSEIAKDQSALLRKRKVADSPAEATPMEDASTQENKTLSTNDDKMDWTSSTRNKKKRKTGNPQVTTALRTVPRLPSSTCSSLQELCIQKIRENILNLTTNHLQFRLPEELLQRVISNLVSTRSISYETLEKVLSPFSQVLSLDNSIQLNNFSCSLISRTCRQLRSLSLSGCVNITTEGVVEIVQSVPYLEVLNLEGCPLVGNAALLELGKRCPNLRSLNVRGCSQLTDSAFTELNNDVNNQIQELDISNLPNLTERGIKGFLGRCFNFASLKLSGNKTVTNDCIEILAVNNSSILRNLEIVGCENLTDASIRALSSYCSNLRSLNISFCKGISPHAFSVKTPSCILFPELAEIDLTRILNMNDETVKQLTTRCPKLESINLSSCEEVTEVGIDALAKNCNTRLLECNLSNCPHVDDSSVVHLANHCPNLRRVSLYNCHGVTDSAIEHLASMCKSLISLDLSSCEKVTDRSLIRLSQSCPSLEVLCVEETTITNEGIVEIARSCRSLNTLKLAYCKGLMDAGLAELARGCPEMRHLDLSYCNNFSLGAIQSALSQWTNLKELHLRGYNAISTAGLRHPRITTLDISWCKNLEDAAVVELGRGCPSLTDLDLAWCPNLTANAVRFLAQECLLSNVNLRGCVNIQVNSKTKRLPSSLTIYR